MPAGGGGGGDGRVCRAVEGSFVWTRRPRSGEPAVGVRDEIFCVRRHQSSCRGEPRTAAVVLMLCDQPLATREIIAGLVVAYLETGYPIVASLLLRRELRGAAGVVR